MNRFKSILAVLPEDSLTEVAFARAVRFARINGAALTLVDVIEAAPHDSGPATGAISPQHGVVIDEDVILSHRDRLSALAARARTENVEVSEAVLQGIPFAEVIRMVLREGHDIVIKGATDAGQGRGTMEGFDLHLLQKCPCPVWMLMAADDVKFDTILAAVDPAPKGDPARDQLDRLVLDLAVSLGELDAATVEVVHAWRLLDGEAPRRGGGTMNQTGQVDAAVTHDRQIAAARLGNLLADYPALDAGSVRMITGPVDEAIADHAEASGAGLLVMGAGTDTVGPTDPGGIIMSAAAQSVLRRVRCSVMAVKPEGFVSPVKLDTAQ